ncbi:MAG: hypothetical protein ACK5HY_13750 [Parahaliea sp.]
MIPFSGNPRTYLKASWLLALYTGPGVYLAFALTKYLAQGDTWVFGWKPLLVVAIYVPLFARFCYRWIMRLDARYGTGSSWQLTSVSVKLPELRHR